MSRRAYPSLPVLCSLPAVLTTVMARPAFSDTVWWRTQGAQVIEQNSPDQEHSCSLIFFTPAQAVIFRWRKDGPAAIILNNQRWSFGPSQQPLTISVKIGSTWLGSPGGEDTAPHAINAMAFQEFVRIEYDQNLEDLLRSAEHVRAVAPGLQDGGMTLDLNPQKMPALLSALNRCRAAMGRTG